MLTEKDEIIIQSRVSNEIIPEIKSQLPGVVGWLLKTIWPKLNDKVIYLVTSIVKQILERHQNIDIFDRER